LGVAFDSQDGGTPIDPNEAEGLIPSLSTQQELNEFELLNIEEAIRWAASNRQVRTNLLSSGTLQLLHRKMFDKTWRWAGRFRTTQKSIGIEAYRIGMEVENLTENVKAWLEHATYPPDEVAARFHHRLVSIHPFPNGNGRHARLATDLLCETQGGRRFPWGSGRLVTSGGARESYIAALQQADRHEFGPLIAFVRS
jgi:Fic-DOC domain mobile mystery protein B